MYKIKKPTQVDYKSFNIESDNGVSKYNLPQNVLYCKKCVISNQRPSSEVEFLSSKNQKKKTINFDNLGICDACRYAEIKNTKIDWALREKELMDLCKKHKKKNQYDCIVPGSGGKDSFYTSHILKYKYGMNPLTVTWAPNLYTDWGWKNFQSWIHSGIDNILITPNGRTHRLLTRLAVDNLFHPFQPFIIGQKFIGAKIASMYNVDLVFYGENEAEYGNDIETTLVPLRDKKFFASDKNDYILGGVETSELIQDYDIRESDLNIYKPLPYEKYEKTNIEVHYLGYYLKWHPQNCFYYAMENSDFQISPERTPGTYSKYNSIDDKIDDLHYYTTGIKFGLGRASYDAAQEIRSGDIDRKEGVALVNKFDLEFPARFEKEIFKYLSIDEKNFGHVRNLFEHPDFNRDYLDLLSDNFRSPHLWYFDGEEFKLKYKLI